MTWELVEDRDGCRLERAALCGGWLYRATAYTTRWDRPSRSEEEIVISVSITFVPTFIGGDS